MNKIAVVSVGRSDYGIYRPILRDLERSKHLHPVVIAGGAHLCTDFGLTVRDIEADGFEIAARVEMLSAHDSPLDISTAIGVGTMGFAKAYSEIQPDLIMVLGDRFEMMAAALAALPFQIPLAHVHGGELSFGAIDDSMRHAITKLSHLHFASTEIYARRIRQLGEEPWRVHVSGAPGLDALVGFTPLSRDQFARKFGKPLPEEYLLVTYHPVTVGSDSPTDCIRKLIAALERSGYPVVVTMPNADSGGRAIRKVLVEALAAHPDWRGFESLGTQGYFSAMEHATAMVGNSSSGIIEAASFGLPVVNIGTRQDGRVRGDNVIDVDESTEEMLTAIRRATEPSFSAKLANRENLYGDGTAAAKIVSVLESTPLDATLMMKRFHDMGASK